MGWGLAFGLALLLSIVLFLLILSVSPVSYFSSSLGIVSCPLSHPHSLLRISDSLFCFLGFLSLLLSLTLLVWELRWMEVGGGSAQLIIFSLSLSLFLSLPLSFYLICSPFVLQPLQIESGWMVGGVGAEWGWCWLKFVFYSLMFHSLLFSRLCSILFVVLALLGFSRLFSALLFSSLVLSCLLSLSFSS